MEIPTIKADSRKRLGTRYARRTRAQGQLPGIIYGHGEEPEPIAVNQHDMLIYLQHGARVLNVELGGEAKQYLIKDVQYDHLQKDPIHFDLARVNVDERVTVEVAIELRGTPKGVHDGGVLEQMRDRIQVECRAIEIPQTLHPSVADLAVGDVLFVKDLVLPADVHPVNEPDEKIAMVKLLAAEEEPEATEEEPGSAEPERIGRVAEDKDKDGDTKSE